MSRPALAALAFLGLLARPAAAAAPAITGETGPGSHYAIWMPDAWNGDLVLYAHGFRNPDCPVGIPTTPESICRVPPTRPGDSGTPAPAVAMRDHLLARGYAFAASSYSGTGFALKDGVQRTHQLAGLFTSRFGRPRLTYLYGHSMGGGIVVKLAEEHPEAYDGVLASCGMVAGSPAQFRYVGDARALFDVFFPGVVRGGIASAPDDLDYFGEVVPAVLGLFDPANPEAIANLGRAIAWASMDQVRFAFASPADLVGGILELLYFQVQGTPGVIDRAHGIPIDNSGITYSGPAWLAGLGVDLAAVNAAAERVRGDPEAMRYAEHHYAPDGQLSAPMIALHTTRDAAVPPWHDVAYAGLAARSGATVVTRTVNRFGHCGFVPAEEIDAFEALVDWVEGGLVPSGGDVTLP
jgi:pimeloyl-ACP methyl ester carboxylesterase